MKNVLFIVGPTGIGKTYLSILIANMLKVEIVSADSRQIYKFLDIGTAKPAKDGLMYRGLMIRHLVMPNNVSGSREVVSWIAENLPKDTYINIMSQYRPTHKAFNYPKIARRITKKEYQEVVDCAREAGLTNLEIQGYWWL